jgi:hypothetical protein
VCRRLGSLVLRRHTAAVASEVFNSVDDDDDDDDNVLVVFIERESRRA